MLQEKKKWFPVTFIGSIVWIAAFAILMVWWATVICVAIGMDVQVLNHTTPYTNTFNFLLIWDIRIHNAGSRRHLFQCQNFGLCLFIASTTNSTQLQSFNTKTELQQEFLILGHNHSSYVLYCMIMFLHHKRSLRAFCSGKALYAPDHPLSACRDLCHSLASLANQ